METTRAALQVSQAGTKLYGRAAEQAFAAELLATLLEGAGGLLLVSGEAGIGKTALAEHFIQNARGRGVRVLSGACYDVPPTAPYALWLDIFDGLDRRAFDAASLKRALLAGSAQGPLLIVLEDMHWADPESLELLRSLGRTLRGEAVLIVATHRDDELSSRHPLFQLLPQLVRESRAERLQLGPLDGHAVRELLADRYGLPARQTRRLAEVLLARSEGNPFFIRELLFAFEDERLLMRESDGWRFSDAGQAAVPAILHAMIERRLAPLEPDARNLLAIAAVIGADVPVRLWQTVADAPDELFDRAIFAAVEAGILTESTRDGCLRFGHALICDALQQRLPISVRHRWHRRVSELLLTEPAPDPDAVARHLLMAEDPRAVYWLILAGRGAASTGAYQVAAERFERAIALIARDPERDGERAWLLCELAEARRYSDTRQALRHLERAIEIAISPTEPDAALLALARLSHARIRDFRNESALDALQAARAAYDALQPTEQARIAASPLQYVTNLGTYAQWLAVHGRYSDALTAAEQYLDGHPDLDGDQQTTGHAWYATALASAALGQPDRARSAFARARARYGEASNAHMVGMMLDWELDTVLCVYAADQPAERQSAVRELRRLTLDSTTTAAQQFAADLLDGRWAEARIAAEATVGLDSLRFYRARVLCELDWQQGHAERAWAHINSVFRDGPATEPGTRLFHNLLHIQRVAAELALDAGRPEIARQWIDANERWMDWSGQLAGRPRALALRACLAEIQGKDAQARRLAEAALELASQPRQALIMIEAELILGRLSLQAGRLEEAEQHVVAALALAERCAAPWEIARARIARVEQHIAAGQIEPAREHLHATHAIAARLEARPLMERVDALDAGSRANVTQSIAPGGLSGRELEVLRLVARGLTNAEIASELFISPRTVEQHLRRIYVKIDARSRSAATRFAIEHGIG